MIIGLDVGGTHTDAVLFGSHGLARDVKVPTDPDNLYETVLTALDRLLENQKARDVKRLVLSTTLATNMVVQNTLPPVAMVVSGGPGIDPEHFRVGEHYYVVPGALDHSGREIEPLDEAQVKEIGEKIRAAGLPYVGVVSKFSVRNPTHELRLAEVLAPFVERVFMGHPLSGVLSFPRRIATTYLNAAVFPVHRDFFSAVQETLAKKGIGVPIRILKPDGGNMNMASSLTYPAQTILSGPSASVMGAIAFAPQDRCCLVLDIGGTTTDMAVILDGAPVLAAGGIEIGPYKTLIRALQTRSIGVGGDSVVRVRDGRISIGPDRLGRALAYGGPLPTPTDAFCVLGMADGGDRERAEKGLLPIAEALQTSVTEAAERVFTEACREILAAAQQMVNDINSRPLYTVHEMHEGVRIQPDQLLVLGGPARQFADRLSSLFPGQVRTVPHWHVANAIGCALARTTCEVTVYADTARQVVTAQGEGYHEKIPSGFELKNIREVALDLVRKKALARGANPEFVQTEVIEEAQFNMVRGFYTVGKNIRVRAQVKPGLIHGYDPVSETLNRSDL
ncbi:hydantoinase/oxoprolinase family protein [Desulfofustis limnaeus]|jgi:N-methylhydantoinase A/oxoprolinase/acetone carboxylase beta subunit|uniref:Hydantoinase/oxoprolinase n=1 Tax=Desulfofustis limnaeus TaxID=2740163 RepID=A0ABM7W5Z9_9BACT|nr:hydantoinase/oxoprolinase family protein [Desulfofustis limnaeus]MDX9893941.1 hydantoinase/oxoprolinase family protein [Desulfofustis sp.]BDD86343.1 hydantoinase/oxoprolinase [Desulfofustis limnaeus]